MSSTIPAGPPSIRSTSLERLPDRHDESQHVKTSDINAFTDDKFTTQMHTLDVQHNELHKATLSLPNSEDELGADEKETSNDFIEKYHQVAAKMSPVSQSMIQRPDLRSSGDLKSRILMSQTPSKYKSVYNMASNTSKKHSELVQILRETNNKISNVLHKK